MVPRAYVNLVTYPTERKKTLTNIDAIRAEIVISKE